MKRLSADSSDQCHVSTLRMKSSTRNKLGEKPKSGGGFRRGVVTSGVNTTTSNCHGPDDGYASEFTMEAVLSIIEGTVSLFPSHAHRPSNHKSLSRNSEL